MRRHKPAPRFVICEWYEQIDLIRRTEPRRYFLFSPTTKRCLEIYLEMKARAVGIKKAA